MPFIQDGGAGGAIGSGLGLATLHVDLDQVVALKAELEAIRDEADEYVSAKREALMVRPLGADPISSDTAEVFTQNGHTAIRAARGYVEELTRVVEALERTAMAYGMVEETGKITFQGPGK
jgi:hypothetical protein